MLARRFLYNILKLVYRLSQKNRHRLTPAGLLVAGGMLAAGIFGIDVRQSMAFQVFSISMALLLLSFLGILFFKGQFRLKRLLPQYATANQPLYYRLQIDNFGEQAHTDLLLIDELDAGLPDFEEFKHARDPQDRHRNRFDRIIGYPRLLSLIRNKRGAVIEPAILPDIAPGERSELSLTLHPLRRGYLYFSELRIGASDPLGLLRALKKFKQKDRLLVLPRTYRIPAVELIGWRKYQQGGLSQASTVGDSQEFMSLRDYRPGDPLRAIHWRSYARIGSPVVKEFHDEFFVRQGLILDTFEEEIRPRVFEEAVSLAASFCLTLPGEDALLDLMFIGDKSYRFTAGRSLGQAELMLEALACARPCDASAFNKLGDLLPEFVSETSGMICVFLNWDEKRQSLVEKIQQVGVPVLVFVIDADTEQASAQIQDLPGENARLLRLACERMQEDLDNIRIAQMNSR